LETQPSHGARRLDSVRIGIELRGRTGSEGGEDARLEVGGVTVVVAVTRENMLNLITEGRRLLEEREAARTCVEVGLEARGQRARDRDGDELGDLGARIDHAACTF
jgi:hypothetical protein